MSERLYKYGLLAIFVAGILLRLILFLQNPSLWGDESALAFNVCNKSYKELFGGLDLLQASPVGFTMIVKLLLDIFNLQSDYARDFVLRIVPFISGVLVVPVFYYLVKLVFKDNKQAILVSLFFFVLNPCAIIYSAQFKQYSTELFFSVLMLTVFYKLILESRNKWYNTLILSVAPWFSYSSFFVLAAGFLALFIKKWKLCIKIALPVFFSCLIYYFVSLKSVFAMNFANMVGCWANCYGFIDIRHPLRLLFRYGELIATGKLLSAIAGLGLFVISINFLVQKNKIYEKILLLLPFSLTLIASFMHKYAIQGRLILFLLPMFSIALSMLRGKHAFLQKVFMAFVIVIALLTYNIPYSYSRNVAKYLCENIKSEDILLMDQDFLEYDIYLKDKLQNERINVPVDNCDKRNISRCREFISELPSGSYYFLSSSYYVKEITEGLDVKFFDLGFKPRKTKAIYFTKGVTNDN